MGKAVLAEEVLLNYLTALAKGSVGFIPGLIVGQTINENDYVLHLIRTPLHETQTKDSAPVKVGSLSKMSDLQESWVAEHAKCVTRMLPGGISVLGIFVIGPDDILIDTAGQNKFRSTVVQIHKKLTADKFLFGNGTSSEKIVLQFARNSLRYSCKSFNVENASSNLKPVEWRFTSQPTRWHQLKCHFNLDSVGSIQFSPDNLKQSLQSQFDKVVQAVADNLEISIFTINSHMRAESTPLSNLEGNDSDVFSTKLADSKTGSGKRKIANILSTHIVDFYQDCNKVCNIRPYSRCKSLELKCSGVLESHIYVHEKGTVGDGIKILKEDILRSLFSRLEMHYETLIEEEAAATPTDGTVLHEPPRRVMISLANSDINFYDYLFPGEGVSEIHQSLQEFLDLKVDATLINKNFEGKAGNSLDSDERLAEFALQGAKTVQGFSFPTLRIASLIVALAILLISIIVQLYSRQ
ncbi:unnamed protein product [Bemisia tabaci]|uniref:Protein odr-4 homolog n=1 Tax=Bemisia tabaci TaxID=7038 RepID=A0A9P0CD28_BEMTA|nr:unnamed protein product [Bemisia tabaci]